MGFVQCQSEKLGHRVEVVDDRIVYLQSNLADFLIQETGYQAFLHSRTHTLIASSSLEALKIVLP